jgi:hypothetical protein
MSSLAVLLTSYRAAACPATPLLVAPDAAAAVRAARTAGVAFIAAVFCCGPARRPAANLTVTPLAATYWAVAR